jgi:hypothetical protein
MGSKELGGQGQHTQRQLMKCDCKAQDLGCVGRVVGIVGRGERDEKARRIEGKTGKERERGRGYETAEPKGMCDMC